MNKVTGIIQVGVKGSDIVMSTLSKANALKDKLTKPGKISLSASTGAASDLQKKQEEKENKFGDTAKTVGEGLKTVAQGMASLNPAQLMSGVAKASADALASIMPIGGEAVKAVGEATGMIIQAGTGAMTAIKNAQSSAIDTMEKKGRQQFFGGGKIFGGGSNLSVSEQAQVLDSVTSKFGKVGDKFGASIKRLLDANKDVSQVSAVAGGNFNALGTDKGFFMNKIASQFSGLPPTLAQGLMSQLTDSLDTSEFQDDLAVGNRKMNKTFDDAERSKQIQIAAMGDGAIKLNNTLNRLEVSLVKNGAALQ
jgi:hypothetical protein